MNHRICFPLLLTLSFAQIGLSQNSPEKLIDQIFRRLELTAVPTEDPMLFGYFFYSEDHAKLNKISQQIAAKHRGFRVVRNELLEDGNQYLLHVEKVQVHSRESLKQLSGEFRELAGVLSVEYDGWDVGAADPKKPLGSIEGYTKYLKGLSDEALFKNSLELYKLGDYSHASQGFVNCIDREFKSGESLIKLSNCFHYSGETLQAIELLKDGLTKKLKPDIEERMCFNLGAMSYDFKDIPATILYYSRAVELNPKSDAAHYGLAAAYFGQGKKDLAREHNHMALQINPNNKLAKNLLENYLGEQ